MRWIVAVLCLVLTGSVQAGVAPRYPTDVPCGSDILPQQFHDSTPRSTHEFLAAPKIGCATDVMLETLYVFGGHDVPNTASMFDQRIVKPQSTLGQSKDAYNTEASLDNGVEYAVDLLRAKHTAEAIEVLQTLQLQYEAQPIAQYDRPLDYQAYRIARSLAIAYELRDENTEALKWAKRSYALRDTRSAWMHVQILTAKTQHDGQWLSKNSVLQLPFRNNGFVHSKIELPIINGQRLSLPETIDLLAQVLYERVGLYPNNDAVTANMLFDLGHVLGLNGMFEDAQYVLELAGMYGDPQARSATTYFQWKEWTSHTLDWLLSAVYGGLLLAAWGLYAWMFRILLRLCSGLQGRAGRWTATIVAGGVLACIGFIFLLGFVAFVLSFSTGQALNVFEGVTFAFIAGCVVVGWGIVWSKILRAEIRPIALWHWLAWIGLLAWFAGLMYFSLMNAMSPNGAQLTTNELMPVLLVLPVVGLFGLWVRKIRRDKENVAVVVE